MNLMCYTFYREKLNLHKLIHSCTLQKVLYALKFAIECLTINFLKIISRFKSFKNSEQL